MRVALGVCEQRGRVGLHSIMTCFNAPEKGVGGREDMGIKLRNVGKEGGR